MSLIEEVPTPSMGKNPRPWSGRAASIEHSMFAILLQRKNAVKKNKRCPKRTERKKKSCGKKSESKLKQNNMPHIKSELIQKLSKSIPRLPVTQVRQGLLPGC